MAEYSHMDIPPKRKADASLSSAPWYWGAARKDEINCKMRDTPEGSYLVRDSENRAGVYVLTLKLNGAIKMIQLYVNETGECGFWPQGPFMYASVCALIENFTKESLKFHNELLDTKLVVPIKHAEDESDRLNGIDFVSQTYGELKDVHNLFLSQNRELETVSQTHIFLLQERQDCEDALHSYDAVLKLLHHHVETASKIRQHTNLSLQEQLKLDENFKELGSRVQQIQKERNMQEQKFIETKGKLRSVISNLNFLKTDVRVLAQEQQKKVRLLQDAGENRENIDRTMETCEREADSSVSVLNTSSKIKLNQALMDERMWRDDNCDRRKAESLLAGKESGTFLIRGSSDRGAANALSIVYVQDGKNSIAHCHIFYRDGYYGFADPYFVHTSLRDLVMHYSEANLIEHNDQLDVTLSNPVFADLYAISSDTEPALDSLKL